MNHTRRSIKQRDSLQAMTCRVATARGQGVLRCERIEEGRQIQSVVINVNVNVSSTDHFPVAHAEQTTQNNISTFPIKLVFCGRRRVRDGLRGGTGPVTFQSEIFGGFETRAACATFLSHCAGAKWRTASSVKVPWQRFKL